MDYYRYKAEKDHIRINGTLLNTKAGLPNRSVTVAFSIPVDTSDGWFWGSGLEVNVNPIKIMNELLHIHISYIFLFFLFSSLSSPTLLSNTSNTLNI